MVTLFLISLLGAALGVVVLAALLVAALVFMARANEAHDGDVYDTDIRGCRANPVFLPDDDGAVDGCGCEDCVAENDPVRAYIESVLDAACDDMASYYAAMRLGADQATCELWRDRVYRGLRERLDDDQRLAAIVLLLTGDAQEAADELTAGAEVGGRG